jgi:hypothetical protein
LGSASFDSEAGPTVDFPDFALVITPFANFVEGYVDIEVADFSATAFFEADGLGGWQTRVVGDDFEFVVP